MIYVTVKNQNSVTHIKHIIIGDLKIIENEKLRKLLTKGPNYRESRNINYSKAYFEID